MPHIRPQKQNNKINPSQLEQSPGCCSEQYLWFSFRYMTANRRHSLEYLNEGQLRDTLPHLMEKLEEMGQHTWEYCLSRPKGVGMETIPYDRLRFAPGNDFIITKDEKVYILRFDTYQGPNKGRIIGCKKSPCAVFHIIGYDFDFSAYEH